MNDIRIIEICAGTIESAIAANRGGAHRIELCSALSEGGLTPSEAMIHYSCRNLKLKVFVLIRPRTGDFNYTRAEFDIMKADILTAKKNGAHGIVTGMLNTDGTVDTCRMKDLIEMAAPMQVTFHRAFDMVRNPYEALEAIIELGCHRILTSGQANKAMEGAEIIKQLIEKATGRIIIMPGSGINAGNILQLAEATGASEFHLSASRSIPGRMSYKKTEVYMAGKGLDEFATVQTDRLMVEEIVKLCSAKAN